MSEAIYTRHPSYEIVNSDNLDDVTVAFRQEWSGTISGDEETVDVLIDDGSSYIALNKEAAVILAKLILSEANMSFESWELENFLTNKGVIG